VGNGTLVFFQLTYRIDTYDTVHGLLWRALNTLRAPPSSLFKIGRPGQRKQTETNDEVGKPTMLRLEGMRRRGHRVVRNKCLFYYYFHLLLHVIHPFITLPSFEISHVLGTIWIFDLSSPAWSFFAQLAHGSCLSFAQRLLALATLALATCLAHSSAGRIIYLLVFRIEINIFGEWMILLRPIW